MPDTSHPLSSLLDTARRYVTLNLDYGRLTAARKTSLLLSAVAYCVVLALLGCLFLMFLSIGVGHLLAETLSAKWAFMIVAGFYGLLLCGAVVFRRQLFVDPVTRFVTRLLVKPPKSDEK